MNDVRRYSEDEVQEILRLATASDQAHSPPAAPSGLTLAQLQDIGTEVGIAATHIAEAAAAIGRRPVLPAPRTALGQPRSVSRIVPIPRAMTDEEWARVVVDLRETFGAQGKIESDGDLRSWTNGNLQVHVEPGADGYRVRMQTLKGDAASIIYSATFGLVMLSTSVMLTAAMVFTGTLTAPPLVATGVIAAVGLGQLGYLRITLPRWAEERALQMGGLAERIRLLLSA